MHFKLSIDEIHYESPKLTINTVEVATELNYAVNENLTVVATCTPQDFIVSFNMNGKGTQIADQKITYLHKATAPDAQVDSGYVLTG